MLSGEYYTSSVKVIGSGSCYFISELPEYFCCVLRLLVNDRESTNQVNLRRRFKMSRAVIAVISIIFSGLVIYLTSAQSPTPINFPYGKVFLLSFFTYFPLRVLWGFFLWPYYFSPLLKLPQAPVFPHPPLPLSEIKSPNTSSTAPV